MQEFGREERVGTEIHRELALLLRDEARDPRLSRVTIQEVRVVRDLSHAKVFFTVMDSDAGQGDRGRAEQGVGVSAPTPGRQNDA